MMYINVCSQAKLEPTATQGTVLKQLSKSCLTEAILSLGS